MRESAKTVFGILKKAADSYGRDRGGRMAAGVAYRTMFALAPLLLIAVFILGFVVDEARAELLESVRRFAGPTVRGALADFLDSVEASGNTAGIIGFALLLWTGSSLFLELQTDLNDIFGVPWEKKTGMAQTVRQRLLGFLWAVSAGLVLIAIWLLNSVWRFLGDLVPESFERAHEVISILTPLISVVLMPLVFGLVYQTLSNVRVRWRAIWRGALFTTIAFLSAAYGAGLYFQFGDGNAANVAGSLFVILLLAYVLSAVFLYGAEVIKALDDYWTSGEIGGSRPITRPEGVVSRPEPAIPLAAIYGFLAGVVVGWWRRR